jgi:hypothetical protein
LIATEEQHKFCKILILFVFLEEGDDIAFTGDDTSEDGCEKL